MIVPACAAIGKTPDSSMKQQYHNSPNFDGEHFVNSIPAEDPAMFSALKEWMAGSDHTEPEQKIEVQTLRAEDFVAFPNSGLRVTWMGHSTALIEIDDIRILIDPVWSKRSSPFTYLGPKRFFDAPIAIESLPRIDAVLISHDHYDHLDKQTVLELSKQQNIRFIAPLGVDARLISFGIPVERIATLDWWEHTQVGQISITATPARHFSGRSIGDRNKTLWAGFAMQGPKHRVYYTGDTGMFPGFQEIGDRLGPFDATLIEIGAYHRLWADLHLGPEQAVAAVQAAQGGLLIPVHWATFNLAMHSWIEPAERLMVAAETKRQPIVLPIPGQHIEPATPLPVTRWWPALPWQTAKEHPVVASGMESSAL